ncbi:hypothetical protein EJB05_52768, partial [Eragrostis curvula]
MVTTIDDLHADLLARALRRLDGRSLAAASCATARLRALAADPETWRALCLAEWPSLAGLDRRLLDAVPPRRLFADASPFPSSDAAGELGLEELELPGMLVSAVDVYLGGAPLLSRVFEATVACAEQLGGRVGEVSLAVEDADGAAVAGEGALRLLAAAMEAPRRGGAGEPEEAKRRYHEFVRRKKGRKESKARREALVDLCCSAASAVVVLTLIAAVALR